MLSSHLILYPNLDGVHAPGEASIEFVVDPIGSLIACHSDIERPGEVAQLLHQPQPGVDHIVHLLRSVSGVREFRSVVYDFRLDSLDMSTVGGGPLPLLAEPLV